MGERQRPDAKRRVVITGEITLQRSCAHRSVIVAGQVLLKRPCPHSNVCFGAGELVEGTPANGDILLSAYDRLQSLIAKSIIRSAMRVFFAAIFTDIVTLQAA